MTDAVDIFLGDMKCALQRFNPQPGDLFVLSCPGELTEEMVKRMTEQWEKNIPGTRVAILADGMIVDHVEPAGTTTG